MTILYISYLILFSCHLLYKANRLAPIREKVCRTFYDLMLTPTKNDNTSNLVSSFLSNYEELYDYEQCTHTGFIHDNVSEAFLKSLQSCPDFHSMRGNHDPFHVLCDWVRNFALPFHELCRPCDTESTLPESDALFHMFFYISGLTTIGYAPVADLFMEEHDSFIKYQTLFSGVLLFVGITFMAVIEAYYLFNLAAELNPLMWVQSNILSLSKMMYPGCSKWKEIESSAGWKIWKVPSASAVVWKEGERKMVRQLQYTFSFMTSDIRQNQNIVHDMLRVFPNYKPSSIGKMLYSASKIECLTPQEMEGLLHFGYSIMLQPEQDLFYRADLMRDLLVIINGHAGFDFKTRQVVTNVTGTRYTGVNHPSVHPFFHTLFFLSVHLLV